MLVLGILTVLLSAEIYTLIAVFSGRNAVIPKTFGNFKHVREHLSQSPVAGNGEFSFVVAGGYAEFRNVRAHL